MATMNTTSNNLWELPIAVNASGDITKTLNTAGTFLDRNIGIKVSTPTGSAKGPTSLSSSSATLSTGTNTLTLTKSGVATTPTVTAGYVSAATTSSATVALTASVTTKGAATYNVSTSNQTISANQYLTGAQTIRGVTTSNIDANKIKSGVTITVGDSASATRIKNVTGTFTSASTVSSGQTAAGAAHILSGYSAWVDGEEVKGALNGSASEVAAATVTGSGVATIPTITRTTTTASGATNVGSGNASTTAPTSGYFVAMKATAPATTLSITKTVNTSGLLTSNSQITASAATTAKDSNTYYITVPSSTITNNTTLPSGTSSSGTINRGSYIKIGVGYNGTDKYYLAQANSGTITISKSGNTTVNGYATANVPATSVTQGTSTISDNTVTRGTASWGTGWITTSSISPASFANTATENVTYLDISNTTEAPMLSSSGYLYINKGYTDNLKISLAKLIPDWPNGTSVAVNDKILSGYKAYDQDGNVLIGSIATITLPTSASNSATSGYTSKATIGRSTSDQYINIPPGYNSSGAYYKISKVANGSAKTPATTITANPSGSVNSSGLVTMSVSTTQNITPTVTAGYISSGTAGTVTVSGSNTLQLDNVNGSLGGTASAGSTSAIINNINNINTTNSPTGTAGTDYWQIKATATGSNGSYTPKYTVTTAGWLGSTVNGTAQTITVNGDTTGQSLYIPKATFSSSNGEVTVATAGYIPASTTVGSFSAATVVSGAGTATIGNPTYNSTNSNFVLTASGSVAAPSVSTAGYISNDIGTKTGNTISGSKTLNKISLTSEKTSGDLTKAPTLARTEKPSGDTWTDAANGSATTTKPTSGPYVQIDAAASTNTVTIKGKVSADGYGTTTQYIAANTTYTVGAAKATTRYIPIKVGVAAANTASADVNIYTTDGNNAGVNISGVVGTKTTTEPTSGYYIAMTASGSGSSKVTTAGWFQTGALTAASTTATKYFPITKATMTVAGTNTVSPTASITGAQATLVTKNNSGISVTATGGGTASVTATATTNTAGYAPAGVQLGSKVLNATSNTTTFTQYLKEVEIVKPSSGTKEFGIKVPNGDSTITFVFHVDSSGNVTVDNEYSLTY